MTKKCVTAAGALALLFAAAAADAGILSRDIRVQQNYFQSGGSTYTDFMSSPLAGLEGPGGNAKIQFEVTVAAQTDFTSIRVFGPGMASPQMLDAPIFDNGRWLASYTDGGFSDLAALNAKYALGSTYIFGATASDPAGNQTTLITYGGNHVPTSAPGGAPVVPLLTAASYDSLQGLDVTLADTIAFNTPFFGDGSTALEFAIFDVATQQQVFSSSGNPATTASLLLPANTLAANSEYIFALGYDNGYQLSGCVTPSCGFLEFENFTFGEFTTGAAASVPEPAAFNLVSIALACMWFGVRGKRRQRS